MSIFTSLDYGRRPYPVELPDGSRVLRAPTPQACPAPLGSLLQQALDHPVGANLETLGGQAQRVVIIVSDATRKEPRLAMVEALLERLSPKAKVTLAVATGTHGPCALPNLGLARVLSRFDRIINHDGHCSDDLVSVGETSRGTPVTLHRCLLEADLVLATGAIVPHYFAGFGAGVKALFPGLGAAQSIRANHEWKRHQRARAGVIDGNPCREDLEEAVALVSTPVFALNVVVDDNGDVRVAVAGDVCQSFRVGARACAPLYEVDAPPSLAVVVSGPSPVTDTLYQASKLVAAAAPMLLPGGTIVLVAECGAGTGPIDVVNRGIYEIGIAPRLPEVHRVVLVSTLSPEQVAETYCDYAADLDAALADLPPPTVFPRAGSLILRASQGASRT